MNDKSFHTPRQQYAIKVQQLYRHVINTLLVRLHEVSVKIDSLWHNTEATAAVYDSSFLMNKHVGLI